VISPPVAQHLLWMRWVVNPGAGFDRMVLLPLAGGVQINGARSGRYHTGVQVGYAELHELVDRLSPAQAAAVLEVVRHVVAANRAGEQSAGPVEPVRRLSFAGALRSGKGDLAARSEEIIRAELGRSA
jgi:hypothetical protein